MEHAPPEMLLLKMRETTILMAGSRHLINLHELRSSNNTFKSITNIYSGLEFTIFYDEINHQLYAIGNNTYGTCTLPQKYISKIKPITYFKNNNIMITKVCLSSASSSIFWISNHGKLFANGKNTRFQLGLNHNFSTSIPTLIPQLENVIDAQNTKDYSIALCTINNNTIYKIIHYWIKDYQQLQVPQEVINLIIIFYKINTVYLSRQRQYRIAYKTTCDYWYKPTEFSDKHIVKIKAGERHSLFLDNDGAVWCTGDNRYGQLGVNKIPSEKIHQMNWKCFGFDKIIIRDISCGSYHNLAVDCNGRLYSWGYNSCGQCGIGNENTVASPGLVKGLTKNISIIGIDCGVFHSYCLSKDGKHYLFGKNDDNECITFDGKTRVTLPFCVNQVIEDRLERKVKIQCVSLGLQNTTLIVGDA